ncbi:HK97-gp10 family putative phage morphogenesis protein [Undibacterium sp. Rencai35W]|uniref:HK97-gp10 family putative phage morphogenesis protein n=1 Tax=Undibacterium sp. Rencai35W TaxID=3413046 RepID=UPI003BF315CF
MADAAQVTGLDDFAASVDALHNALRAALPDIVVDGAAIIEAEIRARAPVRTGNLASAIDTIETHGIDTASAIVQIDDSAQGQQEHYAIFEEFGTSKQPARPFFRPGVQAAAPRAQEMMVERIASIIGDAQ